MPSRKRTKPPVPRPIDPEIAEEMRGVGRSIAEGLPPDWGFVFLAFHTEPGSSTNYISNVKREQAIQVMAEFLGNYRAGGVSEAAPDKKKRH